LVLFGAQLKDCINKKQVSDVGILSRCAMLISRFFLEAGQIISGYQLEGTIAMGGSLSASSAYGDIFSLGTTGGWSILIT